MNWFKRKPTTIINITVQGPTTAEAGRKIVDAIRQYEKRNGEGSAA